MHVPGDRAAQRRGDYTLVHVNRDMRRVPCTPAGQPPRTPGKGSKQNGACKSLNNNSSFDLHGNSVSADEETGAREVK